MRKKSEWPITELRIWSIFINERENNMKYKEFVARLKEAAAKETVYMWGTFGNRLTEGLIAQ